MELGISEVNVLATVLLCILSSLSFCLAMRWLVKLGLGSRKIYRVVNARGFSQAAWRLARAYICFALVLLAALSLFGAINSYYELFTHI